MSRNEVIQDRFKLLQYNNFDFPIQKTHKHNKFQPLAVISDIEIDAKDDKSALKL